MKKMSRHGAMLRGENPPNSKYYEQGRFGRMFPTLEPFAADTPTYLSNDPCGDTAGFPCPGPGVPFPRR